MPPLLPQPIQLRFLLRHPTPENEASPHPIHNARPSTLENISEGPISTCNDLPVCWYVDSKDSIQVTMMAVIHRLGWTLAAMVVLKDSSIGGRRSGVRIFVDEVVCCHYADVRLR